jgi:hypothetical protein
MQSYVNYFEWRKTKLSGFTISYRIYKKTIKHPFLEGIEDASKRLFVSSSSLQILL